MQGEQSALIWIKKIIYAKGNIVQISIEYTYLSHICTDKILGENKSEEDIQRYKPDPYEYILNDM